MSEHAQQEPVRYTYKPSVGGSPLTFELTGEALSYSSGFRADAWRYGDIKQIRMSYRPVSMLAHRFRTDIRHVDGRKLRIVSATWAGIVALTPQDQGYRAFIEELHRRLGAEGRNTDFIAGLPQFHFWLAAATFGAILLALAGLVARALVTADFPAALFLLGFAVWSGWYIGRWLTRNKPHRYAPDHAPRQLLP